MAKQTKEDAIKIARNLIEALKTSSADNYNESFNQYIYRFAFHQYQTGVEITNNFLLNSIENGLDYLKSVVDEKDIQSSNSNKYNNLSYDVIVKSFRDNDAELTYAQKTYIAVEDGDIEKLKSIVSNIAPEEHQTVYNNILAHSAYLGNVDIAKYAVDNGGDIASLNITSFGSLEALEYLHKRGVDITWHNNAPIVSAAMDNKLDIVKYLHNNGVDINFFNRSKITKSVAWGGSLDVFKYLHENDVDIFSEDNEPLKFATMSGRLEVVKYIADKGGDLHLENDKLLALAAANNRFDVVKYLHENGADISSENYRGLKWALQCNSNIDIVKYLYENSSNMDSAAKTGILLIAAKEGNLEVVEYLHQKGVNADLFESKDLRDKYNSFVEENNKWLKYAGGVARKSIKNANPYYYNNEEFIKIRALLVKEDRHSEANDNYAYNTQVLFGSERRVLEYLRKWGKFSKHPLHDIVQNIKIPANCKFNIKSWSDAVMKCGPKMANMVKFADKLSEPEKSSDGKTWSAVNTMAVVSKYAFNESARHPEMSLFCMENVVEEEQFNKAIKLLQEVPKNTNIPDIKIDGANFGMEGARFYKLPSDDFRGLFLGEIVDCCQKLGGNGEECAVHGTTSKNGGFYVIEKKSKIIGETWAWRGTQGELVWDSLESLKGRVPADRWLGLIDAFKKALLDDNSYNVTSFNIGVGGDTPSSLKTSFAKALSPAVPVDYNGYRDSEDQLVVYNGIVKLTKKNNIL